MASFSGVQEDNEWFAWANVTTTDTDSRTAGTVV